MRMGNFIPSGAVVWIVFTALLLSHRTKGQHYFFEEIHQLKSNFDPDQKETDKDFTDALEHVITFENATLLQDDDSEESLPEKIEFPEFYHAQGIISLPYDGIIEPFEAWYGGRHKMSRIDYYYGKTHHYVLHDAKAGDILSYYLNWSYLNSSIDKRSIELLCRRHQIHFSVSPDFVTEFRAYSRRLNYGIVEIKTKKCEQRFLPALLAAHVTLLNNKL